MVAELFIGNIALCSMVITLGMAVPGPTHIPAVQLPQFMILTNTLSVCDSIVLIVYTLYECGRFCFCLVNNIKF